MVSTMGNSTVNIDGPLVHQTVCKKHEFCNFIFPYDDKNVTYYVGLLATSWNSVPTYFGTSSAVKIGNTNVLTSSNEYSAITTIPSKQWVCGLFFSSTQYDESNQVAYTYFEESADTCISNVTPTQSSPIEIYIRNLFDTFDYEDFDGDMAYYITNILQDLVEKNGKQTIDIMGRLINRDEISHDIAYETLKAIGRMTNNNTKTERFELLVKSLSSKIPIIRDGAIIGLSLMNDKEAITHLQDSLTRETIPTLKENINIAIKELLTF